MHTMHKHFNNQVLIGILYIVNHILTWAMHTKFMPLPTRSSQVQLGVNECQRQFTNFFAHAYPTHNIRGHSPRPTYNMHGNLVGIPT